MSGRSAVSVSVVVVMVTAGARSRRMLGGGAEGGRWTGGGLGESGGKTGGRGHCGVVVEALHCAIEVEERLIVRESWNGSC